MKTKKKFTHLTQEDRVQIKIKLDACCSFRKIGKDLSKSTSTISAEVRKRRVQVFKGAQGRRHNPCLYRRNCPVSGYCKDRYCRREICVNCKKVCNAYCPEYVEEKCPRLEQAPFVCNGCDQRGRCTLTKYEYRPLLAHKAYENLLSESRQGFSFNEDELQSINDIVKDGLKRGLSPYNIYQANKNILPCSARTMYRLIDKRAIEPLNMDLPFKVRYRPRKQVKHYKIDPKCRINRTYTDFILFTDDMEHPGIVEMDTIIGRVGGKCLLSLYFRESSLLLLYLRERNNAQSVIDIFNWLYDTLGEATFRVLFPVILTDNGSEFSNPSEIEYDTEGNKRTNVFYCDPGVPNQKAGVEGIHKTLRRILPKGTSFDDLTQEDINMVAANINSMQKKKLNDRPATSVFNFLFGTEVLEKLQIPSIPSDKICLTPDLIKRIKR